MKSEIYDTYEKGIVFINCIVSGNLPYYLLPIYTLDLLVACPYYQKEWEERGR
jgi:hypothetical protein